MTALQRCAVAAAVCALAFITGGCTPMNDRPMNDRTPPTSSAAPLSDEEAWSELTALGRRIVTVAGLSGVDAGFSFTSCNDQGGPPYQGSLEIGFAIPAGRTWDAYFDRIAAAMRADGWSDGSPPGTSYVGRALSRRGIVAQFRPPTAYDPKGVVHLYGECRNMTDHHDDGKTNGQDVTAEVV